MKKNRFKILTVACVVGANLMFSSCVDNLLNQTPGGELASSLYWKTESDVNMLSMVFIARHEPCSIVIMYSMEIRNT